MKPYLSRLCSYSARLYSRPARFFSAPVFLAFFTVFAVPGALSAENPGRVFSLAWKKVPGSRGYIIEYKNVKINQINQINKIVVRENKARLVLQPGDYLLRLAGRNKFGKPGAWTDWHPLKVRARKKTAKIKVETLDFSRLKEQALAEKKKEEEEKRKAALEAEKEKRRKAAQAQGLSSGGSIALAFLPGGLQARRGQWGKALFLFGGFAGSALLASSNSRAANAEADRLTNNGDVLSFMLFNIRRDPSLAAGSLLLPLREASKRKYDSHRKKTQIFLGATAVFYLLNWADVFLGAPGGPPPRTKKTSAGLEWEGGFTLDERGRSRALFRLRARF